MKIIRMNEIMFPEFRNRLSPTPETLDKEGKNKVAVHERIQIIAP